MTVVQFALGIILASLLSLVVMAGWMGQTPHHTCDRYGDLMEGNQRIFACLEHLA